jgi:hypothetical protein
LLGNHLDTFNLVLVFFKVFTKAIKT